MTAQSETLKFEAEVQQVLDLVIHSLYGNREIFLRELLSNASDALDKLRFEALTDSSLTEDGESLGIAIDVDVDARILRIADNGIGMSREDLVSSLGKIASSGTRRFVEQMKEAKSEGQPDLIGQFGVGFYSAFMVADEITVETRRAGEEQGWRWVSGGAGEYTIEEADDLGRGTLVSLHLRGPSAEKTEEDDEDDEDREDASEYLREHRIREVVSKYSDFVEYPIQMEVERQQPKLDDEGKPIEDEEPETVSETVTLNSMKPLWTRPKSEIEEQEYHDFYKHVAHDWNAPAEVIHFKVEGTLEYSALLYLPAQRGMDLFNQNPNENKSRVSLYVRRVLIQKECEDLLPAWMRFVRGVVESSDLPLNVSRETLQDNPKVRQISKRLVKKVLEAMGGLLESDREKYETFWAHFGSVVKEGIYYGDDEDNRISKVCLFQSSNGDGLTTLAEYIERMPEGQEAIYTITGTDRKAVEKSPHLEAIAGKGYEVIFLVDPVDEWVSQRFSEFDGKPLRAVEKGESEVDDEDAKEARDKKQEEFKDLLSALQSHLDEEIKEVRFTSRLKDSAAVLVSDTNAMSANMERMLRGSGQTPPKQKRVLELNPEHSLVGGLKKLFDVDQKSPRIGEYAELLHGQALISEGSPVTDPARFSSLLVELMVSAVS